jgi:hypothetical protein
MKVNKMRWTVGASACSGLLVCSDGSRPHCSSQLRQGHPGALRGKMRNQTSVIWTAFLILTAACNSGSSVPFRVASTEVWFRPSPFGNVIAISAVSEKEACNQGPQLWYGGSAGGYEALVFNSQTIAVGDFSTSTWSASWDQVPPDGGYGPLWTGSGEVKITKFTPPTTLPDGGVTLGEVAGSWSITFANLNSVAVSHLSPPQQDTSGSFDAVGCP